MAIAKDEIGTAHGTTSGGATLGVVGSGVGVPETAASFDGSTGEVDYGDVYDLDGVTPWTVEMELKATVLPALGVYPRILHKEFTDGAGAQGWSIIVLPDNTPGEQGLVQFQRVVNGAAIYSSSVTKISTTVWRHVAWTYDGTNIRCYVDGVLERTSVAATTSVAPGIVSLKSGGRSGLSHFNGLKARLAIYATALSVARIKTHADIARGTNISVTASELAAFIETWLATGSWSDTFDDNTRSTLWTQSQTTEFGGVSALVTVVERNRQLEITPVANTTGQQYNGYKAASGNDLTNTYAQVEVLAITAGISRTIFAVVLDGSNSYRFVSEAGFVYCQRKEAGVLSTPGSFVFSAVTHRFWRIEHNTAAAQIQWRTSPDGTTWTTRATWTPAIALTALKAELAAGSPSSMTGAGVALFDNFGWGVSLTGTVLATDETITFDDDTWLVIPGEDRAVSERHAYAEAWVLSTAEHRWAELFPFVEGWAALVAGGGGTTYATTSAAARFDVAQFGAAQFDGAGGTTYDTTPAAVGVFDIVMIDGDPTHRLTIAGAAHFRLRGAGDPLLRLTVAGGQEG